MISGARKVRESLAKWEAAYPGVPVDAITKIRMQGYQAQRREIERLSDSDLADIGVKRYQLGHVARMMSFK